MDKYNHMSIEELRERLRKADALEKAVLWASGRFYRIGEKADAARMDAALAAYREE